MQEYKDALGKDEGTEAKSQSTNKQTTSQGGFAARVEGVSPGGSGGIDAE